MEPKLKGKRWEKDFEEPIRQWWRKSRIFAFHPDAKKPVFSIDTPPPYVNFPIHMGHAATYTIMDFIARFKRMCGYNVLFPLGLDRNGLPIEVAAEKKFGISISNTPREKFVWMCKKLLEESSLESLESFYRLGHSYNSWKPGEKPGDMYYTDSYSYRALTQGTFIDLWKKGLVYVDNRTNNYCPKCQTTLADAEIEYKDLQTEFVFAKWKVKETGESIVIATTRPELLSTCAMVLCNPEDERYRHLEGKTAIVPVYGKEVPIRPHPYAKPETGTGLVMMCSFGDYTDVRFFREMGLDPVYAIDTNGTMNESAGFLKGMKIKEARERMVLELESKHLVEKKQKTIHRTPICERSKTPIEFIAMPEYYLRQLDFREDMLKKVAAKIRFFAPGSRQILLDWINSLSMDWAISRRRYYATPIPLWYCACGEVIVPPKGKYYRPWKEEPPVKKCPKCGGKEFRGEERVFDTWFDSSISPLYILGYERDGRFFRKAFPCSLRPQGKEIVRTWLYYTLLRCYQLTEKPAFRNAWIHFHILDEKGMKMSKSLGNVVDPREVIERFGAEPFRAWCALEGNIAQSDLKCSFERIDGGSKFLTKLWNIARFISMFEPVEGEKELSELDRLILSEISGLVSYSKKHYENFDFHKPAARMKHFIWEVFASNYVELVKNRAYNQQGLFSKAEQNGAIYTLHKALDSMLLVMHPITPFITHKIYADLRGRAIEKESFPEPEKIPKKKAKFSLSDLMELNGKIWKAKKDRGLSLKTEIKEAVLPEKFRPAGKDLRVTHGIKSLKWGRKLSLEI